jgi:hypothetical protein
MSTITVDHNVVIVRNQSFEDDVFVYEVPAYDKYYTRPQLRISDTMSSVTVYGKDQLEQLMTAIEITLLEFEEELEKRKNTEEEVDVDTE